MRNPNPNFSIFNKNEEAKRFVKPENINTNEVKLKRLKIPNRRIDSPKSSKPPYLKTMKLDSQNINSTERSKRNKFAENKKINSCLIGTNNDLNLGLKETPRNFKDIESNYKFLRKHKKQSLSTVVSSKSLEKLRVEIDKLESAIDEVKFSCANINTILHEKDYEYQMVSNKKFIEKLKEDNNDITVMLHKLRKKNKILG